MVFLFLLFVSPNAYSSIVDIGYLGLPSIAFDENNNLWVLNSPNASSLMRMVDTETGTVIGSYSDLGYSGITFDSDNTMYLLARDSYMSIDSVNGVFFDGDDTSYESSWPFGTVGAARSEPVAGDFDLNDNLVLGHLGIPSEYFIYDLDAGSYSSFLSPFTESSNAHYPYGLAIDPNNGDIYVSTLDEVEIYNGQSYQYLRAFDPRLSNEIVTGLAFDNTGQLWIAATDSIYTIDELSSSPIEPPVPDPDPLTPVPEPSTLLLFASGLVGLGSYIRRKKR